jgi:hypothetical protein
LRQIVVSLCPTVFFYLLLRCHFHEMVQKGQEKSP